MKRGKAAARKWAAKAGKKVIWAWLKPCSNFTATPANWNKDPAFQSTSRLVKDVLLAPHGVRPLAMLLVRNAKSVVAARKVWRTLPTVHLSVAPPHVGELNDILDSLSRVPLFGREPYAVLRLPEHFGTYTTGRNRQAMRTNRSRAINKYGCSAGVVPFGDERSQFNSELRAVLGENSELSASSWPVGPSENHVGVIGRDKNGKPIVAACARVFGNFAILEMFLRFYIDDEASSCRFLVHVELMRELRSQGVEYFLASGALRVDAGLQYLQHLQGFFPAHLQIDADEPLYMPELEIDLTDSAERKNRELV